MGHYCRICGRERPNEQFSGKGHKVHMCKRCVAMPKSERQAIEDKDDIFGFLEQSHISEKNVARLERMAKSDHPQVASLAAIVLDVARVKPYKARRLKFLAQKHPELLGKLRDSGLIFAHHW
jgi:ribosome-binding protein aMBF1 (putative translation factor)